MCDLYRVVVPSIAVGAFLTLINLYGAPWLTELSLALTR